MKLTRRKTSFLIEALEDRRLLSGGAGTVIDLLVVYTPAARTAAGGDAAMVSEIQQAVTDTNQAYANSQINISMRLVHTELVNYTESGNIETDLTRLEGTNDGYMDSVHALRDTYGADLVSLFTNIVVAPGNVDTTGLGDVMLNLNDPNNDTQAFSVVGAAYAGAPDYTLAHETGHNLGADHDRQTVAAAGGGTPIFPYAYGYRFTGNDSVVYHDIMAYDPGTTIPYFSNPNVLYQGVPTGVPIGQPNAADLASTFAQTAPIVANYRPTVVPPAGPPVATVGAFKLYPDAHTLTFSVRYADDIAVDVSTLDSNDLILTAGAFTSPVQFVSVDNPVNGAVRTATYRVTSAGVIPAGPYLLTIQPNQVGDTNGNFIPGGTTLQAPIPTLTANPITTEIGVHYNFTVTYTANGALRTSTLDSNDLRVTGPNGFDYPATFLYVDNATDGTPRTATYQIDSDYVGGWNGLENGVYQVVMQPNQVADTTGNYIQPGSIGSFVVSIAGSSPAAARDIGTLAGTQVFNGAIGSTNTLDYYKFTIAATSHFTLTLSGLSDATDLFLFFDVNNNGDLSDVVDSTMTSTSATMTHTLAPGVYYVLVQRDNAATQNTLYTLSFNANSDFAPPAATLNPATLTTPAANFDFTVTYTDATAVLASSLATGDLLVTGPNSFSQQPALVSVDTPGDGTPRTATYRLTPVSGNWSLAQNGAYSVALVAGQVSDTLGNSVTAQTLGTVTINIHETDPPTAAFTPATLSAPAATFDFTITYTDATAVLASSLGAGSVQVTGPNNFSQQPVLLSVNTSGDGSPRTATYRLTPPGANWGFADDGAYTVALVAGHVSDTLGNTVAAQTLGTLTINIPDTSPPVATLNPATLTTAGASFDFSVTYTDATAVLYASLKTGNLLVTGPNSFSRQPVLVSVNTSGNGSPRTATYRLTPPIGSWGHANNGAYSVSLVAGQVSDTLGNTAPAQTLGTVTVNIPDTSPPTAILTPATLTTSAAAFDFTITYSDATAVLASSLGTGDLLVTGPASFSQHPALVSVDTPGDGTPRAATYRLTPTSGNWTFAQDGAYSVALVAGQVSDTLGNVVSAQTVGTITINIPNPTAPTATLNPATLSAAAAVFDFTVTYTDATAVLFSSLRTGNVQVTGPNGFFQQPALLSVNTPGNGSPRTATYRLTHTPGNWSIADNGAYTVALVAGQVSNTLGNTVAAQTLGTLTVNIPESTPPAATLNPATLTAAAATFDFTVTYTDAAAVLASSLKTGDVLVTGPGGFSQQAVFVSVDTAGDGSPRTATYRLTRAGNWVQASNGSYTVALVAGQVSDTLGNTVAAATLGTLIVNIPDTTPPAAALTSATLAKAAGSFNFIVTYTDATGVLASSLGTGAVRVTGPNGFSQLATLVSVNAPGNGSPRAATYRLTAPFGHANNGAYTVSLVAGQVSDTLGNTVAARTLGTLTVNIPDTTPPRATLVTPANVTRAGGTSYTFKVTYTDDTAVLGSTLGNGDIQVVGPRGFTQAAKFVSRTPASGNPAVVTVTYKITPPGGKWAKTGNGTYTIKLLAGQVTDTLKHAMAAATLGKFVVGI
ncbi:MAG: reprolysin-like metallopeptidase [Tepidisphaerales bacterium]